MVGLSPQAIASSRIGLAAPLRTDFLKTKIYSIYSASFNIGYLRITDFGIARVWREENAQDTSGTPGYMAPEVMCR